MSSCIANDDLDRGFFAVGVQGCKTEVNVGTLWRTAAILGASFVFTVGRRYKNQPSDTVKAWRHIPLFDFVDLDDLHDHLPYSTKLIGVELDERATSLQQFHHPDRACYLLGAEDHGLSRKTLTRCVEIVQLQGQHSLNVAVAGSIVIHDRVTRRA